MPHAEIHEWYRKRIGPFNDVTNISLKMISFYLRPVLQWDAHLYEHKESQDSLGGHAVGRDGSKFAVDHPVDEGIVHESESSQEKECSGTSLMPMLITNASIDISSTAHEAHRAHHAQNQCHLRHILLQLKHVLSRNALEKEVVGKPA